MKLSCVEQRKDDKLREVVIRRVQGRKVNLTRLAADIGENKQTAWNWVNEVSVPNDPEVWERMAKALEIPSSTVEITDLAMELALKVLENEYTDPGTRKQAANLIREISKKYDP